MKAPEYNLLRVQHKVFNFAFEAELFSKANLELDENGSLKVAALQHPVGAASKAESGTNSSSKEQIPIKSKYIHYSNSDCDEYLIDLT